MVKSLMTRVWLIFWAAALSLTWLVPNHFPPWLAFHSDAWIGLVVLAAAVVLTWRVRVPVSWTLLQCFTAFLVVVPWIQYASGLLSYSGQAWVSCAYILGFLSAMLIGARWERYAPSQLPDALFSAVLFAAVISVGLQIYTWLDLREADLMNIWSIELAGNRPYANLGQPNQLATLLIWGLAACMWLYVRCVISGPVAICIAIYILVGLALTQSRMGVLAVTVCVALIFWWRRLWPSRSLLLTTAFLYCLFLGIPFFLQKLRLVLLLGDDLSYARFHQLDDLRLTAWRLFLKAVMERPFWGFGWTDVVRAQVDVAESASPLHVRFAHSHNLFLDLIIWNGIPLGLLAVGVIIFWFVSTLRLVRSAKSAILALAIASVAVHAMLELPLHYAYFLLPTGMVVGVLDARLKVKTIVVASHRFLILLFGVAGLVLVLLVRDYFRVEASYNALRFEQARIGLSAISNSQPPKVLLLNQFEEMIRLGRFQRHDAMSDKELKWMETVVLSAPSANALYHLAAAYAMNGRQKEAQHWLAKVCPITDQQECAFLRRAWAQESKSSSHMAGVKWSD